MFKDYEVILNEYEEKIRQELMDKLQV